MVAAAFGLGALAPVALADDLADLRARLQTVQGQQQNAQTDIADSAAKRDSATERLLQSQRDLENARARLSDIRIQLAAAKQADANLAARLKIEQDALDAANAEVARGEENLANQLRLMGIAARDAYQQQNPLEGLSIVFDASTTGDLSQRIQWNTTIFDTQAATKGRLDDLQAQLNAARDRQAEAERAVADEKAAAVKQVAVVASLESQARAQAAAVESLVASDTQARSAAQSELDADEQAYAELKAQEDGIQAEIQSELARLKAEAEQRAREEAARKAAEAKAAADKAAAERAAASNGTPAAAAPAKTASAAPARSASDPTGYGESRYGLIRPVAAKNGSPFGMRFHPILKYWRMHNGTDFGASTGTPLYAAADGIVLKSGPNGGFGNFVLIGHDQSINGRYVTTGYAHQSRIVVKVGQRVRQGQLIGYVGSTGLSTTPHLHFEVRLNGTPVNPMSYIP